MIESIGEREIRLQRTRERHALSLPPLNRPALPPPSGTSVHTGRARGLLAAIRRIFTRRKR